MMKRFASYVLVLGSVLATSPAWAVPAWCKGTGGERVDFSMDRALKQDDVVWAVHDLVGAICSPDRESEGKQAALEASRAQWSKKLEMNESDWADAAVWAVAQQSSRYPASTLTPADQKQAWSTMDAVDQYMLLNYDIAHDFDANYIADALGPKLSEAGRLAYLVKTCASGHGGAVQWAMCTPDLEAFDFKKLVVELRADKKHGGYERFLIRLAAYQYLPERLKELEPAVKGLREKDPAYARMFELSAAARKQWDALWKSEGPLVALAGELDDARVANSRRAYQGCEDKTWSSWKAAVGAIPAKKFGAVQQDEYLLHYADGLLAVVANDPKGYLASTAFYGCGASAGKPDPLVRTLGIVMERWPGHRGPRTSAHTAILTAGLELDDRSARLEYPDTNRGWFSQSGSSSGGGNGTISSVKAQGDKVHVEFAAKLEKQEQCLQSKTTNRITQIRGDGTLVYELACLKWGVVTVDRRSTPQDVKARYGQGLKPGMGVYSIEDAVIAGWAKPGSATPSMIGGVPVK